ncbi:MAG: hypothetical protein KC561_16865, partial [Myxococcales bacterium]|nr:hypothetical protein [Myxococcales bacterium]
MPQRTPFALMNNRHTLRERLLYHTDSFLARGNRALFMALVAGFLFAIISIVILRAIFNWLAPDPVNSFAHQIWMTFLELTDPGNMNQDNETPLIYKLTAMMAGLSGVVIFSALIAFLTTGLDQAIQGLKKGHSRVLESGHTLILGWGERVTEILRELVEANESESDPVVVILSEEPKENMDEFLLSNLAERKNTRIVTRSGSISSLQNMHHVSAAQAKSAIVLATCKESAPLSERLDSDARMIKAVLALHSAGPDADFPIVTEVFNPRNRSVVKAIAPGRVFDVDSQEILAKVMVQTSRTSGLAVVYSELLSFDGCEMYFFSGDWGDVTFGQAQFHFEDGVPIGVRKPDGRVIVRPTPDEPLVPGDELLIVAEDDSTIRFRKRPVFTPTERDIPNVRIEQKQEKKLIIGWSPKAPTIISEYAEYVLEGSEVFVVLKHPNQHVRDSIKELDEEVEDIDVSLIEADPLDPATLRELDPFSYDNVIIIPQNPGPEKDAERIDSDTIVILLQLRSMRRELVSQGIRPKTKVVI